MEPNLDEIDDYEKPLPKKKTNFILIAFGIAIVVYFLYILLMMAFA